ncbi:MAG: NAD-dependent deacylase [Bacteroidetes bacterium]|nr:NAD-dependent deacylase [Bacteroidota bacterium]
MSVAAAARLLRNARHATAFTGAGISVESGIPPFRGVDGLWNNYDPRCLDIGYFHAHPEDAWRVIKELFYDFFGSAHPNDAHRSLAVLEQDGIVKALITQNIDNLHQEAGSRTVFEFHGSSRQLLCLACGARRSAQTIDLSTLPPRCGCGGILKPDFVFFGESIPEEASRLSFAEAERADVFLLIGTTGEVMPACLIPEEAKRRGATIIEINTEPSNYTGRISDIFLRGKATELMRALLGEMGLRDRLPPPPLP